MARRLVKLSKEEDFAFVTEVEKYPLLWDVTLEIYRRTDLKSEAWEEIAMKLGPKFAMQGAGLSAHFKNLKDTFMQNLKKVRESTRSGAGTDSIYKPKWFLWNAMQFLKKTCAQSESTSNIPSHEAAKNIENDLKGIANSVIDTYIFDETLGQLLVVNPDSVGDDSTSVDTNSSLLTENYSPLSPPSRPASAPASTVMSVKESNTQQAGSSTASNLYDSKGSTKRKSQDTYWGEAMKVMKEMAQQPLVPDLSGLIPEPPKPADTFDTFAAYVAARLRSMDKETARKCEKDITRILLDYP